jgi:hypothetical protein
MGRDEPRSIPDSVREAVATAADIELVGDIDQALVDRFLDQLHATGDRGGDLVLSLTSAGGDADITRRIVFEIDRARQRPAGRFIFLGKTMVYSAAISVMAAFPCTDRYLSRDAMLLIHGRSLDLTLDLAGPMRLSRPRVEAALGEIDVGMKLEEEDFRRLIGDSGLDLEEVIGKALRNWYLPAEEARDLGLVAGIV